jgi:hypothetical protein
MLHIKFIITPDKFIFYLITPLLQIKKRVHKKLLFEYHKNLIIKAINFVNLTF